MKNIKESFIKSTKEYKTKIHSGLNFLSNCTIFNLKSKYSHLINYKITGCNIYSWKYKKSSIKPIL